MATATSGCDRRRGVTTIGSRSTLRRVSGLRWRPKNGRAAHMPSPRTRSEMAMREDIDACFALHGVATYATTAAVGKGIMSGRGRGSVDRLGIGRGRAILGLTEISRYAYGR